MVFAELEPYEGNNQPSKAVRLWHGILANTRWVTMETIPVPTGVKPTQSTASTLVHNKGSLAWALEIRDSPEYPNGIIVFEKKDNKWSHEIVPILGARSPDLQYSDSLGLVLAVAHPDPDLSFDRNSFFMWARQPRWTRVRKIAPSQNGRVHFPKLHLGGGPVIASWGAVVSDELGNSRLELRAMIRAPGKPSERVITLDSSITSYPPIRAIQLGDRSRIWLVDHIAAGERREIRVLRETATGISQVGSIRNAYFSGIPATLLDDGVVMAIGAGLDQTKTAVYTVLEKFKVECRAAPKIKGEAI